MQRVAIKGVQPGPTNVRYVLLDQYNKSFGGQSCHVPALCALQLSPINVPTHRNAAIKVVCYSCTLGEVCRPFRELAAIDICASTKSDHNQHPYHSAYNVLPSFPFTVDKVFSEYGEPKLRLKLRLGLLNL